MKLKMDYLFCLITALIVFVFYLHTVNYPWKYFDEQIIYNETILPIPLSFSQIFEYISYFGLNNYFEASNPFYSSISNLRCDPINNLITLFVYFFFQKNAWAYHLLSLSLHVLNTGLLFLTLRKVSLGHKSETFHETSLQKLFTISILTLLWALHPVNVESILFTSNWSAILTYSLCIFLLYYFLNSRASARLAPTAITMFVICIIPLFTCEYSVTIPLILFFYTFANYRYSSNETSILTAIKYSFKKTLPLFLALIVFIAYFLFSHTRENLNFSTVNSISLLFERIFWFSPQIFFHFIKLILYPAHLSIDQTAMVHLSKSLFNPYSIFCSSSMYLFLLLLFISFLLVRKKWFYLFFISFSSFTIALLPFLHILSPTYCLISERYLYLPLLMLVFGLSHIVFYLFNKGLPLQTPTLVILALLLCAYSVRTYIRTIDWRDSVSLFESALKEVPNDLYKGLRLEMLGAILSNYYKDDESHNKGTLYFNKSISTLEESLNKLEEEKEKEKNQNKIPEIIKAYGLDPKTIQAKTAYLLSFTKFGLGQDINSAIETLRPHMRDLSIVDTQILDFYLGLLFSIKDFEEAERLIKHALKHKLSPHILVVQSELYKQKYNDLQSSEKCLLKSLELSPYDIQTLLYLKRFYFDMNKPNEFALFSYLYGIRVHYEQSLKDAYFIYTQLNNKKMAEKALKNIELLKK